MAKKRKYGLSLFLEKGYRDFLFETKVIPEDRHPIDPFWTTKSYGAIVRMFSTPWDLSCRHKCFRNSDIPNSMKRNKFNSQFFLSHSFWTEVQQCSYFITAGSFFPAPAPEKREIL